MVFLANASITCLLDSHVLVTAKRRTVLFVTTLSFPSAPSLLIDCMKWLYTL